MKNLLIVILSLLIVSNLFGQGISYNEEFHVNTYTNGDQEEPAIASLSNGGFVVCWTSEGQDSSDYGIYAQIYNENGIKSGNEFQVNTYTESWQVRPSVSGQTNGRFVVCWQSYNQDGHSYGVYAQMFDNSGIKIGAEFQVNTYTFSHQVNPSISNLNGGGFVICWQNYGEIGLPSEINAQMYDENGTKVGVEFLVNTYTEGSVNGPAITNLKNGGFVVCWREYREQFSTIGIYAQIFDDGGLKVGEEFRVNTYTVDFSDYPAISSLVDGGFIICWQDYAEIFGQQFDFNGIKVGAEFQVNTYTENSQWYPSVSGLVNGGYVVCWESNQQDLYGNGIYAQMYDKNGVKLGTEFLVNTYEDGHQSIPSTCVLKNNALIICWESGWQDENGNGIFGKYFLGEPVNHALSSFESLEPVLDATIFSVNPMFIWKQASYLHFNFPWELTYDLYIDNDESFSNPLIISGIEDTTYQIDSLTPGKTYFWKVLARNYYGDSLWSLSVNGFYIDPNATDVNDIELIIPEKFELFQNYPNPFNPSTKINYSIPEQGKVELKVFDVLGREIKTLINEEQSAGTYDVEFDAKGLSSGIYFYKLQSGSFRETKKMLLLR